MKKLLLSLNTGLFSVALVLLNTRFVYKNTLANRVAVYFVRVMLVMLVVTTLQLNAEKFTFLANYLRKEFKNMEYLAPYRVRDLTRINNRVKSLAWGI